MVTSKRFSGVSAALAILALSAGSAQAGSHLWRIAEVYSSADGLVQFIEFVEIGGSDLEFHLTGRWFMTNAHFYQFPSDLPGPTANLRFLIATQAFADLPGAPQPDYIVPDNFIDPAGDQLVWFTYDTLTIVPGMLATDGVNAFQRFSATTQPNSPTNFAGETGSVNYTDQDGDAVADALDNCSVVANPDQRDTDSDGYGNLCDPDLDNSGTVDFVDLGMMKAVFFQVDEDADLDGDGAVNFPDLGILKAYFFGPPGPGATTP